MKLWLLSLTILFLACQEPTPRYVVTEGRAEVKVPIESITVEIAIRSKNKSMDEANQETRKSVLSMFRTFQKFGIPDSLFITTNNRSSDPHDSFRLNELAEVTYEGTVQLADPKLFDPIFNELVQLGNVSIRISNFNSSKEEDYRKRSYEAALRSARKQADLLLSGTGAKVGRILKVLKDRGTAFEEYDDFEKHIEKTRQPQKIIMSHLASPNLDQTFRRKYYEVNASVTVMFEIE